MTPNDGVNSAGDPATPSISSETPVKVECYAGGSWCDHPIRVIVGNASYRVVKWIPVARTPKRIIFAVELEGGFGLKLIYDEEVERWIATTWSS